MQEILTLCPINCKNVKNFANMTKFKEFVQGRFEDGGLEGERRQRVGRRGFPSGRDPGGVRNGLGIRGGTRGWDLGDRTILGRTLRVGERVRKGRAEGGKKDGRRGAAYSQRRYPRDLRKAKVGYDSLFCSKCGINVRQKISPPKRQLKETLWGRILPAKNRAYSAPETRLQRARRQLRGGLRLAYSSLSVWSSRDLK